jgi:hypothetical protein
VVLLGGHTDFAGSPEMAEALAEGMLDTAAAA